MVDTALSGNLVALFDDLQTHNFVSIVDELVNEPLKRIFRVVVRVQAAEKGPRPLCVFVVLVFPDQCERVLFDEVGGLVKRVEGYARLENTKQTSARGIPQSRGVGHVGQEQIVLRHFRDQRTLELVNALQLRARAVGPEWGELQWLWGVKGT